MGDILGFDTLFAEMTVGLGLALVVGNLYAWWKAHRGEAPEGVEGARFRPGRVLFLTGVGVLLTVWGTVSLLAGR
jgi:hypothetical protein